MNKVLVEIESCKQCGYLDTGMSYSLDGFDRGNDWMCNKSKRLIVGFVESIQEGNRIGIPDWCELRVKNG